MRGVGMDATAAEPPFELDREEDVQRLRLPVRVPRLVVASFEIEIVEIGFADVVTGRRHVHDARRRSGEQRRDNEVREQEVPEVVRAELELEPVGGALERRCHDTRVVDQQVQPVMTVEELLRGPPHRRQRGQIELEHLDRWARRSAANVLGCVLTLGDVAHAEHNPGARGRERSRRLGAEAGPAAGDKRQLPRQIDPGDDLVGGRGASEHGRHPLVVAGDAFWCRPVERVDLLPGTR